MHTESAGPADVLIGRSYTKARRYQWVIGSLPSGPGHRVRLPFGPYTLTQIGVGIATLFLVVQTRTWWASGGLLSIVVAISLPIVAALGVRRARIEGRDPLKAAVGLARHLATPTHGRVHNRPTSQPRPVLLRTDLLLVLAPAGPDQTAAAEDLARAERPAATAAPTPTNPVPASPRPANVAAAADPAATDRASTAVPQRARPGEVDQPVGRPPRARPGSRLAGLLQADNPPADRDQIEGAA